VIVTVVPILPVVGVKDTIVGAEGSTTSGVEDFLQPVANITATKAANESNFLILFLFLFV
jgi:hypothetical protein